MLIVNTTYQVTETIAEEWEKWLTVEYIPQILASGQLRTPRFQKLLVENEPGHLSYALQFEVNDQETLDTWFRNHGQKTQSSLCDRFQEKVLAFTTLMEVINL